MQRDCHWNDASNVNPAGKHPTGQDPEEASRPNKILLKGEASYIAYRMGRMKLLRPGAAYVLLVEYPEDAPRTLAIINTGNETLRGFHTGLTVGDALHAKYVNNNCESLDIPLSGKWESWTLLFRLHDRFPRLGLPRGTNKRELTLEQGFDVTIAQFSARNCPMSRGIAVSRIKLFEVLDEDRLALKINFPPDDLPRRRIFWREEMSDSVIAGKKVEERGLARPIDWYRYKAELMRFLGINTYSKDLLEFGACQHWDSTPYGGHDWLYFTPHLKHLWADIVKLMGTYGHDILPYYEYAGSKGRNGLGFKRRAKPLTRDDAYTHIRWVESANVDITDPDAYEDFKKILDLTIIRFKDKARFVAAWIRSRSQIPISFADATRTRFAREANKGRPVSRNDLIVDKALYERYIKWWRGKRRDFFCAMRDHLRKNGIENAFVLYTGCPAEAGVGFHSWLPRLVTDSPEAWRRVLKLPEHLTAKNKVIETITPIQVIKKKLYLEALTSPGLTWGKWEVHHARPADDPETYKTIEGVLLSHPFNRLYTVASQETLELFRNPTGLAIIRHYPLNENMMFDKADRPKLGYFIADIERGGPYCMMAEAIAMAYGDPTMIGYLSGNNFARGFPQYVRDFNANFLALPALPSKKLPNAATDPAVVVRAIKTPGHGTYLAVVNTARTAKRVTLRFPAGKRVKRLATGEIMNVSNREARLELRPFQLVAIGIDAP